MRSMVEGAAKETALSPCLTNPSPADPMKHQRKSRRLRLPALATAAALALLLLPLPAFAASLTLAQVGDLFCTARLSGDMAPVLDVLTPELQDLVSQADPTAIRWQGKPDPADLCRPVGASGSYDAPQSILSYQYRDPGKAGFSDRLVMRFIDDELRLDDIVFSDGTSLRDSLAPPQ